MSEATHSEASSLSASTRNTAPRPSETLPVDFDAIRLEDMPTTIRVCEQNIQVNGWMLGGMLISAKKRLPHGSFMAWLKTHTDISQTTANNLMSLHNGVQETPFLAELKQSAAVMLLALAPEQRKQYAAEHDVNAMSVRQLRDDLERLQAEAESQLADEKAKHACELTSIAARMATLKEKAEAFDGIQNTLRHANQDAQAARKEAERLSGMYEAICEQLEIAKNRESTLEQALMAQPISISTVEVEKLVEVLPPDYEHLKEELAIAAEFAESMEHKAKEAQAELRRLQNSDGETLDGLSSLRHAVMEFLAKATFLTGVGTTLHIANSRDQYAYLQCVDAVQVWCEDARKALPLIATTANDQADVK